MTERASSGPLAGLRVLELGSVLMAPYAAQWLADLGADVVKVEPPAGDSTRRIGPAAEEGMAAQFLGVNRGKRSIVLDLKAQAGRGALLELARTADVLLHNNRPQKMKALGLHPEALLERNPRLVYACFHGFGEDGPYGGRPAYDDVIQGFCGLAHLMGERAGAPAYLPIVAADKTAGLTGAVALLAALMQRERTGRGCYVEIPMFESLVAFTALEHLYGHSFDPPKGPAAYPRVMTPERRPYATADGYICVLPYTDKHWGDLFRRCGRGDLAADPRFADVGARTQHIGALYGILADLMTTRPTAEWLEILGELEVPCAPVKSLEELVDDPHLAAVGFFSRFQQPDGSAMRLPGVPVLFDGARPPIRPPPRLGEHTKEILEQAGLGPDAWSPGSGSGSR